jgi:hypothetical protein
MLSSRFAIARQAAADQRATGRRTVSKELTHPKELTLSKELKQIGRRRLGKNCLRPTSLMA